MPGPLTYAAIALMARDRLGRIRDALEAKKANGLSFSEIETQVLYLARQAHRLMSLTQPAFEPTLRLYAPPFGDQVSKFLLLGAAGPEIPGYAALFAPGQRWLRDTIHKGTPDENLEQGLVRSTDFALEFWRRVEPLVAAEFSSDQKKHDVTLSAMQAYVYGHLCHVAADVVSSPFLDDVEGHLGTASHPKLSRDQAIGAIETAVSSSIFRRGTETRSGTWGDWWPSPGQVPSSFFKAYRETLEELYGPGARHRGLAAYEAQRDSDAPPELSDDLLRDGYSTFRTVVQTGSAWDLFDWMGVTAPMFLPILLAMPVAAALPAGSDAFREPRPAGLDPEIALYEAVVFPFAATSILPLLVTFGLSLSYLGVHRAVVFGWVSAVVQVIAAVAFFTTLGGAGVERWIPIFAVPLVLEVVHVIYTLAAGQGNPRHWQLALSSLLHILLSLIFLLFNMAFLHLGIEGLKDDGGGSGSFWGLFGTWFLILLVIWLLTCLVMRYLVNPRPPGDAANAFVTGRSHHVRLFDDSVLFHEPRGTSPTLANLYYPSGRRELLKIWWEGGGDPKVRSLRDQLVFDFGGGTVRTVHAPIAPTRLSEYAQFLERTVKDGANNARLKTKVIHPGDLDYELPPGAVFSDEGDDQTTESDHAAKAAELKPLGHDEGSAHVLYHAPKVILAVQFHRDGPVLESEDRTLQVLGTGTLTSAAAPDPRIVTAAGAPPLTRLFQPGDVVEAPVGGQRRVIVSVDGDAQITVSTPFNPALAGIAFARAAQDRRVDTPAPAGWTVQSVRWDPNDLSGAGGAVFGSFFRPGDVIRVLPPGGTPQERVVTAVMSDTRLKISRPLDSPLDSPQSGAVPLPAAVPFARAGEQPAELFGFVAGADDTAETGEAVMNHAADLATLLCLGATSHLLTRAELDRSQVGGARDLNEVYQVFRNWNLDRRRVNEWKMLVLGGAVSEKRGRPAEADPALPASAPAVTLTGGETTANRLGWLPLLRAWVDMARRPGADATAETAFRPGNPTNRDLSRALAFLLDMRDPAAP